MDCINCHKKYARKSSFDKHLVLCDFINTNKRGRRLIIEEEDDIPTYHQLVKIVQELSLKYSKLDTKMDEMQKWVDKKKKKIDIITWLNSNALKVEYDEWYKNINVSIDSSFEHNISQIFLEILQENLAIKSIYCFNQKQHIFYMCEHGWRKLLPDDFMRLLKNIQFKLMRKLGEWKDTIPNYDNNDKMVELYNKTMYKLLTYNEDVNINKIKTGLYNYLKIDLKNVYEYEFEF
jgi:hypothetical protein